MSGERPSDVKDVLDAVMRLLASETGQVSRLRVESGDAAVELEWGRANGHPVTLDAASVAVPAVSPGALPAGFTPTANSAAAVVPAPPAAVPAPGAEAASGTPGGGSPDPGRHLLTAPMVGTFYHAPAPGEPPFVAVGDVVEPGQQIGILEAMKLMNSIEADRAGRVVEILVSDGTPVEYDQPLIALAPVEEG